MKNTNKKQSQKGRKVCMTLSGLCLDPKIALDLYPNGIEHGILAKAIVDKDGNVIGSWQ